MPTNEILIERAFQRHLTSIFCTENRSVGRENSGIVLCSRDLVYPLQCPSLLCEGDPAVTSDRMVSWTAASTSARFQGPHARVSLVTVTLARGEGHQLQQYIPLDSKEFKY